MSVCEGVVIVCSLSCVNAGSNGSAKFNSLFNSDLHNVREATYMYIFSFVKPVISSYRDHNKADQFQCHLILKKAV